MVGEVATGGQITSYAYGITVAGGSTLNSLSPLHSVTYPDAGTVIVEYNRQGDVIERTDQNGTVHQYGFDLLGRPFTDGAVTLPDTVDNSVLLIALTYEIRGMVQGITSYADTAGTTVVNDVQREYNGFRQPITEYQEHAGAVNMSTSLKVQYSYADGSANTIRPTGFTYPNGNTLAYDYGTADGPNDLLSRVQGLISSLSSGDVTAYSYLGLSTPVQVQYPLAGVQYNLTTTSGTNLYPGLDNFGRVIDCRWQTSGGSPSDVARLQYGYGQASNRLWRLDAVAQSMSKNFDEIYSNDGLYRLTNMRRGQLNGAQTAINMGTLTFEQDWTLDPTGNWNGFTEDATGSGVTLEQARTANPVNEITAITNNVGSAWTQPGYDAAGNMTTLPLPPGEGGVRGVFDAWKRLVKLVDPSTGDVVQVNAYDGRNFRIVRESYTGGALSETRQFYHTMSWQVLEERVATAPTLPDRQYTWGLRYIDDLVLRDRTTMSGTLAERLYAMQDANWNMVAICDDSGDVKERFVYSAYGVCTFLNHDFTSYTGTDFNWTVLYTGRELDAATGLYYYRNRYYLALLGLFVTKDPIEADTNPYRYCGNGPTVKVDPSGLEEPYMAILGGYYGEAEKHGPAPAPVDYTRKPPDQLTSVDLLDEFCGKRPRPLISIAGDTPFTRELRKFPKFKAWLGIAAVEASIWCSRPVLTRPAVLKDDASRVLADLDPYETAWTMIGDGINYTTRGRTGNLAASFLGSWDGKWILSNIDCCKKTATITFHIGNWSTWDSATLIPHTGGRSLNHDVFPHIPLIRLESEAKQYQSIEWSEILDFSSIKDSPKSSSMMPGISGLGTHW